ncbi:hypothetical protein [Streptomyces sp. NPDC014793]|uniref:hypothetical protein n=1 Tax=Streptomyces sp. NPDC014793 TaxID=3364914 RepID=UPI003700D082
MHEVLAPLREHADVLLPALLEEVRQDRERHGDHGEIMGTLLQVAEEWGPDALHYLVQAALDAGVGLEVSMASVRWSPSGPVGAGARRCSLRL